MDWHDFRNNELVFSFGPFRLIPRRHLLMRDGCAVKLGGRSFELLHLLVQRNGQLVGKDELIAAAWPDTFVHDGNLKVNISSLRRALGDTQAQPSFVATIAGRGYRFVAPVQVSIADVSDPAVAAKSSDLSGLPHHRDMVGRETDIVHILADLRDKRHVTLVGAGGIGKTTLAVAVARAFEPNCPDGVCFVDLSTINDPALVPVALAAALGIRGNPNDALVAVLDYLRQRRTLVVLDNCEHVLSAAAMFANGIVVENGKSTLLATSREPLETAAEHIVWIDPLACPETSDNLTASQAMEFPAIELFARRASEWADYELADLDCAPVARICRALDGLPLAIELVAAKMTHHSAQDLLAMLDQHLSYRNPFAQDASPRHETLMATIDWSFQRLSHNEATIFRLASVFADAFELDDVAAIAGAAALKPAHVASGLGGLVGKSLVTAQMSETGLSYRLLDSTRRYAIARRQADPIDALALECHARRILALLKRSEEEYDGREARDWLERYRGRLADLRAALSWAFGAGHAPELGIALTAAAIPLWSESSLLSESQRWVSLALTTADAMPCDDLLKAKLACSRGWGLFYARKQQNENEDIWLAAIAYAKSAGNPDYHMRALLGLSYYLLQIGHIARAIERLEELGELSRDHQDWPGAPDGDRALAWAKAHAGDLQQSWHELSRQAAVYPRPKKRTRMAELDVDRYISTRFYLPIVAWLNGHMDYAAAAAHEAVEASASAGHLVSQSNALGLAALPVALYNSDLDGLARYTAQLQFILEREDIARWVPVQKYFAATLRDLNGDRGAVRDMRASVDELIECRYLMRIGMYLGHLADVLARQGQMTEADEIIAVAFNYQEQNQERWCRSELLRVKASILQRAGRHADAVRFLVSAKQEAHAIGAMSFELRIANDLAAYYIDCNRNDDAIRVLQPLYQSFSEGFSTGSLVMASQPLRRATTATLSRSFSPPWEGEHRD